MVKSSSPREVLIYLHVKRFSIQIKVVSSIFLFLRALSIVAIGLIKTSSISKKTAKAVFLRFKILSGIKKRQYKAVLVDLPD